MLTPTQIACQTQLTKDGHRNMKNRKPFSTARQKEVARQLAYKSDGHWNSTAPVSYHR